MTFRKISMSGPAGSGKDHIADQMVKKFGMQKISFASPIKKLAGDALGFTPEQVERVKEGELMPEKKDAMRRILQLIGTEVFRDNWSENVWVDNLLRRVSLLEQEGLCNGVVVTDTRFQNEFGALKMNGFFMIDVQAPESYLRIQKTDLKAWSHPSERNLDDIRSQDLFDMTIWNDWKEGSPSVPWEKQIIDRWDASHGQKVSGAVGQF